MDDKAVTMMTLSDHRNRLRQLLAAAPEGDVLSSRAARFCRDGLTPAAVLIGAAPDPAGRLHVLLTRRAAQLRRHGGQIAFPGGKTEPGDADAACALRETEEETGAAPDGWEPLGLLPLCCTPSGFAITPVLALSAVRPEAHAQEDEVAEVFWLPLSAALDSRRYTWREHPLGRTPALDWQGRDIWGATALMLYYLAQCAAAGIRAA